MAGLLPPPLTMLGEIQLQVCLPWRASGLVQAEMRREVTGDMMSAISLSMSREVRLTAKVAQED